MDRRQSVRKNAFSDDLVLKVSRVGSMFSTIERLFPASKAAIFRKFALLTKLMVKSLYSIRLASGSIGKLSEQSSSL